MVMVRTQCAWRRHPSRMGPMFHGQSSRLQLPSRPGEFHPEPLTEPYVNLSLDVRFLTPVLITRLGREKGVWAVPLNGPGCQLERRSSTAVI